MAPRAALLRLREAFLARSADLWAKLAGEEVDKLKGAFQEAHEEDERKRIL